MHPERLAHERPYIAAWLAFVEAGHRDPYTMATLREMLENGEWSPREYEVGRAIADMLNERC